MTRLRRAAALAAVVLVFAACGSSAVNVKGNPAAALRAAATRTANGKTVTMQLSAKQGNFTIAAGTGAYDFVHKTARFTLSGALLANLDLVITPATIYVKTPRGPKAWESLTQAQIAKSPSSSLLSSLRSEIDPRQTLNSLGETTKNVRVVGDEQVRDAKTTHVHADVDLSDAAIAKTPATVQASLRQARATLQSDSYPIDVWLDNHGRVRRVTYALTVKQSGQANTTTVELDLYDFGKDAGIVVPNAVDVSPAR